MQNQLQMKLQHPGKHCWQRPNLLLRVFRTEHPHCAFMTRKADEIYGCYETHFWIRWASKDAATEFSPRRDQYEVCHSLLQAATWFPPAFIFQHKSLKLGRKFWSGAQKPSQGWLCLKWCPYCWCPVFPGLPRIHVSWFLHSGQKRSHFISEQLPFFRQQPNKKNPPHPLFARCYVSMILCNGPRSMTPTVSRANRNFLSVMPDIAAIDFTQLFYPFSVPELILPKMWHHRCKEGPELKVDTLHAKQQLLQHNLHTRTQNMFGWLFISWQQIMKTHRKQRREYRFYIYVHNNYEWACLCDTCAYG